MVLPVQVICQSHCWGMNSLFVERNFPPLLVSRGVQMKEPRKQAKAEFAAWMKSNMDRMKLSQNKLARLAGVSVTTINRYCNADDDAEPKMSYAKLIAKVFNAALPAAYTAENTEPQGFSEPGVTPIEWKPALGEEWNGNISAWTVKDNSMQFMGYLTGDEVKADDRIKAVDGDVVVANLYENNSTARTVLRVYKAPGYLVPATTDLSAFEVHEVGKNAAVFGVVFESLRRRAPH